MKTTLSTLLFIFLILNLNAQCPDCEPDTTCIGDTGPMMCPEFVPDGTANEYYEEVITFYMPYNFNDPETGASVTLNEVVVTNVQGIPLGLDYTINDEDLTYYPSEGEEWGCVTLCGVPLLPGVYEGTIFITAQAEAFGIPVEVNEQFVIQMIIYEGDGTNNSFSYNQLSGCEEAVIHFEGLIDASPQVTTWDWDFGNGNLSDQQIPPDQIYSEPGEYTVSLQTNIYNQEITQIDLNSLSGGWSGDVEELIEAFSDPDPYFTITDGGGFVIYTSSTADNTSSNTWTGLSIAINEPPYNINFYDEDAISADDFLGSYEISSEPGSQYFNVNSGTSGFVDVGLVLDLEFYNEETVTIHENPDPIFVIDEIEDIMTFEDASLVAFDWYYNGELLDAENNSSINMDWGVYFCEVTNEWGCSAISDEYINCPNFVLTFDPNDEVLAAPIGFESYQWYLNGDPIDGATENNLNTSEYGAYYVSITTDYGCEYDSPEYLILHINDIDIAASVNLYPNPNKGVFTVDLPHQILGSDISFNVIDLSGRIISTDATFNSNLVQIDLGSNIESGQYIMMVTVNEQNIYKRFVVE